MSGPLGVLLALLLAPADGSYDEWLERGIAAARAGREADADTAFARAIALDPARPEALVERGGLRFLQRRYEEAAVDLRRAVLRREDVYARDLLASSLLLAGHGDDAVRAWNPLGRPLLRELQLHGIRRTRARLYEPDLRPLRAGEILTASALRATRLRLEESGLFDRVALRPLAAPGGRVDVDVALAERHGLGPPAAVGARAAADLLREQVRLRYANVAGAGITVSAGYKWERTQPHLDLRFSFVRPFGLPAHLDLGVRRARPMYDPEDDGRQIFTLRSKGGDARLRGVIGDSTIVAAGLHFRRRTFDVERPDTPDGTVVACVVRVSRMLHESRTGRLEVAGDVSAAPALAGGDVGFGRGLARLRGSRRGGGREVAVQLHAGLASRGTPLDELFTPGAASEMELPLRAHRQKRGGVLGRAPIGGSLVLANVEWRQRLGAVRGAEVGGVLFYDGARIGRTARGGRETAHDVGLGLRLALRDGAVVLRLDAGHGINDGKNSLTAGIGQVF